MHTKNTNEAHLLDPRIVDESYFTDGCSAVLAAFERYEDATRESANSSLSPKYRALIALAVSLSIPCSASAKQYRDEARAAGASNSEFAGTAFAAAALRAGGALAYGRLGFKFLEQSQSTVVENDANSLAKDREYMTKLRKGSIAPFSALMGFNESLHKPEFPLSPKHYELIAFAVALTTQCVYCVDRHINDARKAGATDQEIADTVHIAGVVRARSTLHQGIMVLGAP